MTMTEKATYDPDLPHEWMRESASKECALCGRPPKDELHQVPTARELAAQQANFGLVRELGS